MSANEQTEGFSASNEQRKVEVARFHAVIRKFNHCSRGITIPYTFIETETLKVGKKYLVKIEEVISNEP
jgi:hypothetical protein